MRIASYPYSSSIWYLPILTSQSLTPYSPVVGLLDSNITALWIEKLDRASSDDWPADINGGGVSSLQSVVWHPH